MNAGVRNEVDPALAILQDFVKEEEKNALLKTTAIIGLGIAYAGTWREDVMEMLTPFVTNTSISFEMSCLAALSLGQIFVSSCNGSISEIILETLMERDPKQLKEPFARYMALGLALLYLGNFFFFYFVFCILYFVFCIFFSSSFSHFCMYVKNKRRELFLQLQL